MKKLIFLDGNDVSEAYFGLKSCQKSVFFHSLEIGLLAFGLHKCCKNVANLEKRLKNVEKSSENFEEKMGEN